MLRHPFSAGVSRFASSAFSALFAGLAGLAGLAGCGGGEGVDVELSVDPAISSEEELAQALGSLVWILDHEDGLYDPGEEVVSGDTQVKNADSDPALEVVTVVHMDRDDLPAVRIARGGLAVGSVDVRVLGLAQDGAVVADGAAEGLSFGGSSPVSVPFDFRDALRPPRVRGVFPEDGAELQGCSLQTVTLVFTRPMDPASLGAESVLVTAPGVEQVSVVVAPSGVFADVSFAPPLEGSGSELTFRLEVATSARAVDGTALDQAGSEAGSQAFSREITLKCGPPPTFPCVVGECQWACGDHECPHSPEIACLDGVCTPVACAEDCPAGDVCDPLRGSCVRDCRSGEALSACAAGACDEATGLCAE